MIEASKTIMIDHMHQRLLRWADWSALGKRAAGLWFARCSLADWGESGEALLPDVKLDEEASDTDRAVTQLPDDLRAAVRAMYLGRGTVEQRARDCRCHKNTLYNRVARAHGRLVGLFDTLKRERQSAWPVRCVLASEVFLNCAHKKD